MSCLKCGRDAEYPQVFCEKCLVDMEKNPVKPGTPVYIPSQPAAPIKRPRVKTVEPEEQIHRLRTALRWVSFALVIAIAALSVTMWITIQLLNQRDQAPSGQNYSVVDTNNTN